MIKNVNWFYVNTCYYYSGSAVVKVLCYSGIEVAQRLRCCATVGPQ